MQLSEFRKGQERIRAVFRDNKRVYIYGAGVYAEAFLNWLMGENLKPDFLLVSDEEKQELKGVTVQKFQPWRQYDGAVIMALASKYHEEIMENVVGRFKEIIMFSDDFFRMLRLSDKLKLRGKNGKWRNCTLEELIKRNRITKTVILQRGGGMGDILTLEPLCRALKRKGYQVGLMSNWDCLFSYNGSVDFVAPPFNQFLEDSALYISVELAHEVRPLKHMLDAYVEAVSQYLHGIEIKGEDRIPLYDKALIRSHRRDFKKICINTEASGWQSRIYDLEKMKEVAKYLRAKGYDIYEVGADRRNYLGIGQDCFGLALHDSVELMSKTDLYVGLDNGLMHLAQAIRLPIFVLFGCTCPLYRIHDWSRARVMWKNVDELPCAGCYHRRRLPCIKTECMYEKCCCLDWSVEEVIYAFEHLEYGNPPVLQEEMLSPIWP